MSAGLIVALAVLGVVGLGAAVRRWWLLWIPVGLGASAFVIEGVNCTRPGTHCDGGVGFLGLLGAIPVVLLLSIGIVLGMRIVDSRRPGDPAT